MKTFLMTVMLGLFIFVTGSAMAEPRSVPTAITKMRPYTTGTYLVTVASSSMNDNSTCTTTYAVQDDALGAKAVIASLLTAYALAQDIQIEIPTGTGCTGFGTPIQSVFLAQ